MTLPASSASHLWGGLHPEMLLCIAALALSCGDNDCPEPYIHALPVAGMHTASWLSGDAAIAAEGTVERVILDGERIIVVQRLHDEARLRVTYRVQDEPTIYP